MGPILIFEQDCLHTRDKGEVLSVQWVRDTFYTEAELEEVAEELGMEAVRQEYQDEHLTLIQAFNTEGERWKFIQSR